jgi:hypothetical protein
MARLRQAFLYCLKNIGIWCQTGAGSLLSELLFQFRSDLNSDDHACVFLGYASGHSAFQNTIAGFMCMIEHFTWIHPAYCTF